MKAAAPITGPSTVPGPPSRHITGTFSVMRMENESVGVDVGDPRRIDRADGAAEQRREREAIAL